MGLRIRTGGQILDLSGDEYNPGTLGTKRLKIRTGGQIKEYGLTTDPSAKSYCGLNFNLNGSKFYIGRKTSASGSTLTTTEISSTREGNATRVSDYRDGYWNYTYTYEVATWSVTATHYTYNYTVNTYRSRSSYATASTRSYTQGISGVYNYTSWENFKMTQNAAHTAYKTSRFYNNRYNERTGGWNGTFAKTGNNYRSGLNSTWSGTAVSSYGTWRGTVSETQSWYSYESNITDYYYALSHTSTVTGLNSYRGVATQSGLYQNGTVSGASPLSGGGRTVSYNAGGNWNAGAYSGTYNPNGVMSYNSIYQLNASDAKSSFYTVTSRSNSPVSSSYYTYWATRQSNYTYESNYTYTTNTTIQSSMSTHNFV